MPLRLPDKLPAIELLKQENIFVMDNSRATSQDIRSRAFAFKHSAADGDILYEAEEPHIEKHSYRTHDDVLQRLRCTQE